ncbi:hypothetical protein QR680_018700 [Steinernema hermaphroditum]|uniref:DNA2/NAM7 helicase-like C-terminal domain-containing protein n=1 Tax=Steinernema hermaphroditum TaxID=289476 RepID=A0AA39HIR0_9BILA|nr:hypothetical protein QR680_018700 [Steinernema hermaphroditum]
METTSAPADVRNVARSRANPAQEKAAAILIEAIEKWAVPSATQTLTYYKGASAGISARLKERNVNTPVATLDSFQGQEQEITVVVTTCSPAPLAGKVSGGTRKRHHPHVEEPEEGEESSSDQFALSQPRAIVAATRAKSGMVVVGNFHHNHH